MSGSWTCDGDPKDGKSYANAFKHEPYENYGPDCVICGLPKEAMGGKGAAKSATSGSGKSGLAPGLILLLLAALAGLGGFWWWRSRPATVVVTPSSPSPTITPSPTLSVTSPAALGDRFSSGERVLFAYKGNAERDRGVEQFKNQQFAEALLSFEKAIQSTPNDPEPQIYRNNAKARQAGNPLIVAAVVPVDNSATSAEEMLRGIADAQTAFNDNNGINSRLLEVIIVNDSNDATQAAAVAQQLANDPNVIGVVGHNSSDASAAALPVYTNKGIAMISPTSTSTALSAPNFFRTVPSDQIAGEKLADYVVNTLSAKQVAVFYAPNSKYSSSIQQAFTNRFTQLGGKPPVATDLSEPSFDVKAEVTQISSQAQVALLFPSTKLTSVAIGIARSNAALPTPLKLVGGDALYTPATLTEGGNAVKGLVLVVPWYTQGSYATQAERRWLGQVSWRTASSYDATQAFLAAFKNGSIDRAAVVQGLKSVNLPESQTSGQALQFAANGDRVEPPLLVEAAAGAAAPQGAKFGFKLLQ
jgi:branched-chain amino acid transport system substrate-binding protein